MVATTPASAETNKTSPLVEPTKHTKLKMEVPATPYEDLFPLTRDMSLAGNLDAQTLLDEWLANDLQRTGFLSEGDEGSTFPSPSSAALTDTDGSPCMDFEVSGDGSLFDSPLFEEDAASALSSPAFSAAPSPMITPASILERSPVIDSMMNLFPELGVVPDGFTIPTTSISSQTTLSAGFTIPYKAPVDVPTAPLVTAAKAKRPAEGDPAVMDDVSIKRQKNTDAARRSRLKKVMKMESLEQRVSSLEADNSKLVLRVAVLESEKTGLESKELDYEKRIKRLEQQLADAHKALTSRIPGSP